MPCQNLAKTRAFVSFTALNLYKRQPGLARRSALLQQISASIRPTFVNFSNQLATYEMNGQADWMRCLSSIITAESGLAEPQLQANLVMQLASIQSRNYQAHLSTFVNSLESQPGFLKLRESSKTLLNARCNEKSGLKIAWMTGDCNYHPVSRFLYGWLASCSSELHHSHTLVNLEDHREESYCKLFNSIPEVGVQDVSGLNDIGRLNEIRREGYDVVVDLSGWTGVISLQD